MTAYHLLVVIGLFAGGDVLSALPSRLTSVLAMVLCLVVGVGFCWWLVFSCFGFSCVVVSLFSPVHHTLRHT